MGFWSRLKRIFRAEQYNSEIEEELQYHLAMKQQDGYDPRAARVQFGSLAKFKEEARSEGVLPWLESGLRDVRYALRQMRKAPLFTVLLVLSLALGIGANTAIFSLVDAALLEPLPVPAPQSLRIVAWVNHGFPEELCRLLTGYAKGDRHRMVGSPVAVRIYRELARQQYGFASLIGFSDSEMAAVALRDRPAEQFRIQYVSPNFFAGLRAPLQLGRPFSVSEDREGQPPLIILSNRFWRKEFAGRPDVLGQVLRVNNVPVQIVGVARAGFFGLQIGEWVDLYAPLAADAVLNPQAKLNPDFSHTDRHWWVSMMARPKAGVSQNQAIQALAVLFQRLVVPPGLKIEADKIPKLMAIPGQHGVDPIRPDESRALWIVFLLVGLILLIVCANVANLLLSRAVTRQRESAVCLALGAARHRLFRQYLTESLLLASFGGVAGLFLSFLFANALHSLIRQDMGIGGFDLHINAQILGFTCLASLTTAVLCGVAPAWMLARASVHDALKASSRTVLTGRLRLPRLLVIAQVALSFTVLVAAGLLARSLANLRNVDVGFNRANLVYASVNPWSAGYQPEQVNGYVEGLRRGLAAIPGVLRVATVEERPLSGDRNATWVNIPGRPFSLADTALVNHVGDGFFETLGVPVIAGRTFSPADLNKNSDAVVVNELFACRFYGSRNPLGEQFGTGPHPTTRYRIIGVVQNSRHYSLREPDGPAIFWPYNAGSRPGWRVSFVLRTALSTGQLTHAFRQVARKTDPAVPVIAIETQTQLIDSRVRSERLLSIFATAFGTLAMVLSAIGLLGLFAYMVARRTNEIGVRMALGAGRGSIASMVLRDAFALLLAGVAAGIPGALWMGRILKHTLFHLSPTDPVIGLLTVAIMMCVAALSSWIPASRAARVDPMLALREE
ncbi:MAG TPA: ABC transporter permease [Bryobacteraceae bacterium]|nr:ABC transporter permease [Bryobacteraceae bacterium]